MKPIEHIKNFKLTSILSDLENEFNIVKYKINETQTNHIMISCSNIKSNKRLCNFEIKFHLNIDELLTEKVNLLYHPNPDKNILVSEITPIKFLVKNIVEKVQFLQLDEKYIHSVPLLRDEVADEENQKIKALYEEAQLKARTYRLERVVSSGGNVKVNLGGGIGNMYIGIDFFIF